MRNFTFTLFVFVIVSLIWSCKPTIKEAIDYNDTIISLHTTIQEKYETLLLSYDKYEANEMDKAYSAVLTEVNQAIKIVAAMKPFDGDASFKDGALELFNTYKSILETEHKRIIELLKLPAAEYKNTEMEEDQRLRDSVNKKVGTAINKLIQIQENFSKTHQFEVNQEE